MDGNSVQNSMKQAGQAEPQPKQVSNEVDLLDRATEELFKLLSSLEGKLGPVLLSRLQNTDSDKSPESDRVELASELLRVRRRMDMAIELVYSMQDRLEL